MKKILYLAVAAVVLSSCATGYYMPGKSHFDLNTNVVLSQANFRIVRNLDVTVEINNDNLKRVDVEKSAYAELLRQARLTGSQALANVVVEEIRRENMNLFGFYHYKQYVTAHATIVEFLDASGQPIPSVSPYVTNQPSNEVAQVASSVASEATAEVQQSEAAQVEFKIPDSEFADNAIERLNNLNARAEKAIEKFTQWNMLKSRLYNSYAEVYEYLYYRPNETNLTTLELIQKYIDEVNATGGITRDLGSAKSTEEKIRIFLKYANK